RQCLVVRTQTTTACPPTRRRLSCFSGVGTSTGATRALLMVTWSCLTHALLKAMPATWSTTMHGTHTSTRASACDSAVPGWHRLSPIGGAMRPKKQPAATFGGPGVARRSGQRDPVRLAGRDAMNMTLQFVARFQREEKLAEAEEA